MKTLAILFAALSSAAHAGAPDFTVAVSAAAGGLEAVATPPPKHHINIQAPMEGEDLKSGGIIKPASAKPQRVSFRFKGAGERDLVLRLYLCDDANTFCEKHEVKVRGGGAGGPSAPSAPSSGGSGADLTAAPGGPDKPGEPASAGKPRMELGFIVNDPKAALAEASRKNAPLMIDFFGIWCPPCNMLDETVFPSKEFRTAAAGFVKLKLDADKPVSWELKSRYNVRGYPTVILASADGDEIARIVGFRPRDEFLAEVAKAWLSREAPFAVLKRKADDGDVAAAWRVGSILIEREDFEAAEHYISQAAKQPGADMAALLVQVGKAQKLTPGSRAEALERALKARPDAVEAVDWHASLAEAYDQQGEPDKAKAELAALIQAVDELVAHPERLIGHDALPADLLETAADAQEKLGPADKAKAAWLRAADAYRAELKKSGKGGSSERGFNLELAYCLGRAGEVAAAEKIYSALERKFPREFTFYFGHARMLFGRKDGRRALPLAKKAYDFSYGDNRLRAAELLARIYADQGRPAEGLTVIRMTLDTTELPSDSAIRTHRYADKLKALAKTLAEAPAQKTAGGH